MPIPWSGTEPPFGFGPGDGQPWLPQPPEWAELSVEAQTGVEGSALEFVRRALAVRHDLLAELAGVEPELHVNGTDDQLVIRRGPLVCHLNTGSEPIPAEHRDRLLAGATVLLCSGSDPDAQPGDANTATWLHTSP